jgi:hypothetical protein
MIYVLSRNDFVSRVPDSSEAQSAAPSHIMCGVVLSMVTEQRSSDVHGLFTLAGQDACTGRVAYSPIALQRRKRGGAPWPKEPEEPSARACLCLRRDQIALLIVQRKHR